MPQLNLAVPDLSSAVPIIALVMLAALILIALTARTLIKSRAFAIALVAVVIIAGSSTIVGSLQSIAVLIGVAGVVTIGLVIALGRNPDVTDLLHSVARQHAPAPAPLDHQIAPPRTAQQLPSPMGEGLGVRVSRSSVIIPNGWGFDE